MARKRAAKKAAKATRRSRKPARHDRSPYRLEVAEGSYIRQPGSATWHWRPECPNTRVPDDVRGIEYTVTPKRPTTGLCKRCLAAERKAAK